MRAMMRRRSRRGTRVRDRSGQALAEFVLVIPIFLLLVFGIVEFGLAFRTHQIVTNAAREGARVSVLPSATEERVLAVIEDRLVSAGLEFDEDRVTLSCREDEVASVQPGLCAGSFGFLSQVEVEHPYTFFVLGGLVRWACGAGCADSYGTIDLRTRSVMRNE